MSGTKYIVGLTGQTGAGKSSVCSWLTEKHGIQSVDCDAVSREITTQSPCLEKITQAFGKNVLSPDGKLDRKALGKIVFSDPEKLSLLNETVHPIIIDKIIEIGNSIEGDVVIFDAPTLIESGLYKHCNIVVSVTAHKNVRQKRIMERDNITTEEAQRRIDAQKSEHFYTKYSDICILNEKYLDDLHLKSDRLAHYINHIRIISLQKD